jgi:quinol monooxygenase YgiN
MADRVVAITRIAGRRDELRELMLATEARVAAEPDCRLYRFAATLDDPDEYVHVQEWAGDRAFEAHQSSAAFRDYTRALFGLLARPSDMTVHRGESVNLSRQPARPGQRRLRPLGAAQSPE